MRVCVDDPEPVEHLKAMVETRGHRVAMRVTSQARPQPKTTTTCVVVEGSVGGLKGRILIDSGSSINAISPSYAAVAKVAVFPLESPVGLQLGCVGSRSKINFGISTKLKMGDKEYELYLDVVNLDHYDMVLGMPFLQQKGVTVDFATHKVSVGGMLLPMLKREGSNRESKKVREKRGMEKSHTSGADRQPE